MRVESGNQHAMLVVALCAVNVLLMIPGWVSFPAMYSQSGLLTFVGVSVETDYNCFQAAQFIGELTSEYSSTTAGNVTLLFLAVMAVAALCIFIGFIVCAVSVLRGKTASLDEQNIFRSEVILTALVVFGLILLNWWVSGETDDASALVSGSWIAPTGWAWLALIVAAASTGLCRMSSSGQLWSGAGSGVSDVFAKGADAIRKIGDDIAKQGSASGQNSNVGPVPKSEDTPAVGQDSGDEHAQDFKKQDDLHICAYCDKDLDRGFSHCPYFGRPVVTIEAPEEITCTCGRKHPTSYRYCPYSPNTALDPLLVAEMELLRSEAVEKARAAGRNGAESTEQKVPAAEQNKSGDVPETSGSGEPAGMQTCLHCGKEFNVEFPRCPYCGMEAIVVEAPDEITCACGHEVSTRYPYCPYCRRELEPQIAAETARLHAEAVERAKAASVPEESHEAPSNEAVPVVDTAVMRPAKKVCPVCKTEASPDANFCGACGHEFS